jgi:hypothetical protein
MHSSLEDFRKGLDSLSQRFQAVREEFRRCDMFSGALQAALDRIQREKDALALKLSDAERNRTNWDLIKAEFGGSWNSFVADLNLLELRLLDAESTKTRRTDR